LVRVFEINQTILIQNLKISKYLCYLYIYRLSYYYNDYGNMYYTQYRRPNVNAFMKSVRKMYSGKRRVVKNLVFLKKKTNKTLKTKKNHVLNVF